MRQSAVVLQELQEHQTQVISWEECLGTHQPKPAYVRIPEDLLVLIMTCVCVSVIVSGDVVTVEGHMV